MAGNEEEMAGSGVAGNWWRSRWLEEEMAGKEEEMAGKLGAWGREGVVSRGVSG